VTALGTVSAAGGTQPRRSRYQPFRNLLMNPESSFENASYDQLDAILNVLDKLNPQHLDYLLEWIDGKVYPVGPPNGIEWLVHCLVDLFYGR
jgi:hypothetical protein